MEADDYLYIEDENPGRHKKNYAWCLNGHSTNVPNIAFLDSPPNEYGRVYLASIDIDGKTKIWDVWKAQDSPVISPRECKPFCCFHLS